MKKTIIFDLDGTLLDTLTDLTGSVNFCMEQCGYSQYTKEDVRSMVGNGIYLLMERALPGGREDPFYDRAIQLFTDHYKEHMLDSTCPFPGIPDMLQTLVKRGFKLAIVSNKFDAAVKGLNQRFFADFIEVAIGESSDVRKKPAPDSVLEAIRELGSTIQDSVYVGDSEVDIQTAQNADIPCLSVCWGFKSEEFLKMHGADAIFHTVDQLLNYILKED